MRAAIFVSHSTEDVEVAKWIRDHLSSTVGIAAFVAHEDIEPSAAWREEIIAALKDCKALSAVLSEAYDRSDWCDQETGFAAVSGKLVIPLIHGRMPRGFLSAIQGLRRDNRNDDSRAESLRQAYPRLIAAGLIDLQGMIARLGASGSWSEAGDRAEAIVALGRLPTASVRAIHAAVASNDEVRQSYKAKDHLEAILTQAGLTWPE